MFRKIVKMNIDLIKIGNKKRNPEFNNYFYVRDVGIFVVFYFVFFLFFFAKNHLP